MKRKLSSLLVVILLTTLFPYSLYSQSGSVSVFSGIFNRSGSANGSILEAQFHQPSGAVFDSKGNLYIVEYGGGRLRKIDTEGIVTSLAGGAYSQENPDGQGAAASFFGPSDVIITEKDTMFVSDQSGNKIRKVDMEGNVVTLAGSVFGFRDAQGSQAQFRSPSDLALGSDGNIYVADQGNHRIRMVDREGNVTTILGDGSSQTRLGAIGQAVVASPRFIDFDRDGNLLIASQYDLYKLDFTSEELIHLIGQGIPNRFYDGFKSEAHFRDIKDLYVNEAGVVYIGDGRVLRQYTENGYLVTVSGNMSNFSIGGDELGNAAYVDVKGLVQRGTDSLFIMDQTRHVAYLVRVENGVSIQNADITSDVTWTKEASPHVITEDITISSGAKLTIEPGALVKRNLDAGIIVKGAISAEGQEGDSIHFSDGHGGHLLVGKYFLTFEEANLSLSKLTYVAAKSQNSSTTPVIRIGNEITSRTTAATPVSGHLDIENSYFDQAQLLTDSRSTAASVKLKNSWLENAVFFVVGKESVEIDNALITNSDLKNDERLTLSNSTLERVNVFLKNTSYNNNSVASTIVRNSIIKESGIASNELADFEISDSELVNTAIYVPSGNLKITDVKSTLDREYSRIREPNGNFEYFSHFITGGSAQISGLFLNTNDNKSGIYITGENSQNPTSSLTASTLRGDRSEALFQYKQEKDLTITSTNFISTRKMINNFSSKTISASGNYFKGLLDAAAIEQEVYHKVDNSTYGLVDFSTPSAIPFFGPIILGPEVKFGRLFGNDYLDDVAIRFNSVDPKTEKLLVYKYGPYGTENLTLLAEVIAPFGPLNTPYEESIGYAVIAEDASGKQAEVEYATNRYVSMQIMGARITIDEDEEYEFQIKLIADPVDSVAVWVSKNTNTGLISNDDISISFLKEDGDTTFFQVRMKPLPEAFGFTSINFTATNGISQETRGISQNVRKINEFKPAIEGVDPVTGLFTDRTFEISHTTLSPFVQFSDQDGGEVYIKITSVINGTLTKGGSEIQNSETIPYYSNAYSPISWTPPSGESGLIDAFKIRVYDEDFDSEEEAIIQFQVRPNTPPVIIKIDTTNRNYEDQYHYIRYGDLKRSVEFTDEQGDEILFVITEVVNGALWNTTQPELGQVDLPATLSNENNRSVLWLPPANQHGGTAAFKIKAADVSDVSDIEHTVYFDVKPSNDAPFFDFVANPLPKVAVDTLHSMALTGISPGPLESEQTVSFKVTSSDQSKIPDNQVDVVLKENGVGELTYLPVAGIRGTVELLIKIIDNLDTDYQQRLYLTFLQPDAPPVIGYDDTYNIHVGNSFELVPDIYDDRAAVSSRVLGDVPSWLVVNDSLRLASLSANKHYSKEYQDGLLSEATFGASGKLVLDKHGNLLLAEDRSIRKISPDGLVSTIAGDREYSGYKDGPARQARFYGISGMTYDSEIDVLYIIESGNNAVRKLDANGMVTTFYKTLDNLQYGNLGAADLDKDGNLYVSHRSRNYRIFKFDREGNLEFFAGTGESSSTPMEGPKDQVSVGDIDGLVVTSDGTVFISNYSQIRRIGTDGNLSVINLPDEFLDSGGDTYLFKDDEDHLLLSRQSGTQVLRFNIRDLTFEVVIGKGNAPFSEEVLASHLKLGRGFSGYDVDGMVRWNETNVVMSMGDGNNGRFLGVMRQKLDTIKGIPTAEDIGTYQITIEAEDIGGAITRKVITLNVLANNQITATNTEQELSFTEDAPSVDLKNIVLSGMSDQDSAIVRLNLDDKLSGRFSTNSGNGEVFIDSTGVWQIISNQTDLNITLSSLAFIPNPDYDLSFSASLSIVNAKGGVSTNGNIKFDVTPVSDASRLSMSIEDEAFVDIPYTFNLSLEDPDTELFNLRIESLPSWLNHETGPFWVEKYVGIRQDSYRPVSLDGDLETAGFDTPEIIAADNDGNLFVVEKDFVKKITLEGKVSTHFRNRSHSLDGQLPNAGLGTVSDIIFDKDNNMIVADNSRKLIKKVSPEGLVTTIAGSGGTGYADDDALRATFTSLSGLELDADGNLYILDYQIIRRLDDEGKVTTIAGNRSTGLGEGDALEVPFFNLRDIEIDSNGDLIIADDRTIRKLDLQTNKVTLLVGKEESFCCSLDGKNEDVSFLDLTDIQLDDEDNIYGIAYNRLFKIDLQTLETRTLGVSSYGTDTNIPGSIDQVGFRKPFGIEILGGNIFLTDLSDHAIHRVSLKPGELKGEPAASDLGEHTVSYHLLNGKQESRLINAVITVFDNDFPRYTGIDSTYYYTEDQPLSLQKFQLTDDSGDDFSLELELLNNQIGQLLINGFEGAFNQTSRTWLLEGSREEINEALQAMSYIPNEHNFDSNTIKVRTKRNGGTFLRVGKLDLLGVSINDIPVFEGLADRYEVVGAPSTFEINLSDADKDLLTLRVDGLPTSYNLNSTVNSGFSYQAGSGTGFNSGEGLKEDIRLSYPSKLEVGPNGLLHFIDNKSIRVLTSDSLKWYSETPVRSDRSLTHLMFRGEQLYIADAFAIYAFDPDGTTTRVTGSAENGDTDGNGLSARFSGITVMLPGPGTRDMYILDQGVGKIKYIDDDFNVTTVFSLGDNNGIELSTPIHMARNIQGAYYILDYPGKIRKFIHQGELEEVSLDPDNVVSANLWSIFRGLQVDNAGNLILFSTNRIYMADQDRRLKLLSNSLGSDLEGNGLLVNLGYMTDLLLTGNGEFVFSDISNRQIRKANYKIDYSISGTPTEADLGEYSVSLTVNDGYLQEGVKETFTLIVEGSDKPSVNDLSQEITYTEDAEEVTVAPIIINSESVDMEFEISIIQTPNDNGFFRSSNHDLSTIINNPEVPLQGTAAELNNILAGLYFQTKLNNTAPTRVELAVKEAGGALDASGIVNFTVVPVNDGPEIKISSEDTTAFVGVSIIIPVDAFDPDGSTSFAAENNLPEWLSYRGSFIKDELVAGTPGKSGFKNGDAPIGKLLDPTKLDVDSQGNIYVLEADSYMVRKITIDGDISDFAGEGLSGFTDGVRDAARFSSLADLVIDYQDNIYVSDSRNFAIRKITPAGEVTTYAGSGLAGFFDGDVGEARFGTLGEMSLNSNRTQLFVHDTGNRKIRVINLATDEVTTMNFSSYDPNLTTNARGLAVSPDDKLYLKYFNYLVRSDLDGNNVTFLNSPYSGSGDGTFSQRSLNTSALGFLDNGNILTNDLGERKLRIIAGDYLGTVLGAESDGYAPGYIPQIKVGLINDFALLPDGGFVVTDLTNHVVRRFYLNSEYLTGTPTASDVGENIAILALEDSDGLKAIQQIRIDVKAEDILSVTGLDKTLILKEGREVMDLPSIVIADIAEQVVELSIGVPAEMGSFGTTPTLTLPYSTSEEAWYVMASVDSINKLLEDLKFYPSESLKTDLLTEFRLKRKGEVRTTRGYLNFVFQEVNQSPEYVGETTYEIAVGEEFDLKLLGSDLNGDSLAYSVKGLPTFAVADSIWYLQEYYNPAFSENIDDSLEKELEVFARDMVLNAAGDVIFADDSSNQIRKLTTGFEVMTLAGSGSEGLKNGPALEAEFSEPYGLAYRADSSLLIIDRGSRTLRVLNENGQINTLSGSGSLGYDPGMGQGIGSHVSYIGPSAIAQDSNGHTFLVDFGAHTIRVVKPNSLSTVYAGATWFEGNLDGPRLEARFKNPSDILVDENQVYLSDLTSFRWINEMGEVETIAGSSESAYLDGPLQDARFESLQYFIQLEPGVFLASDFGANAIRKVSLREGTVSTIAVGLKGDRLGNADNAGFGVGSLLKLPQGETLMFDRNNRRFLRLVRTTPTLSILPSEEHIGTHTVSVTISDGKGGLIEQEIILQVTHANTSPEFTTIPDLTETYAVDGTLSVSLFDYFSDAEDTDEQLTYEVVSNSDNTVISAEAVSSTDGVLTLNIENAGSTALEVKAIDIQGASVSTTFTVIIEKATATITISDTEFVFDGEQKMVTIATDPTNLEHTVTYGGSEIAPSAIGTYAVAVELVERNYKGSATAELSIVNIAPEDISLSAQSVFENQQGTTTIGTLSVTDENPVDTHSYSLPGGVTDNALFSISGTTLSANQALDFETRDAYEVTVKVEDDQGESYQELFVINVLDINDAPEATSPEAIEIVKDLGPLSFTVSGLNTGGEPSQILSLTTTVTGVLANASAVMNTDGTTGTISLETLNGQEGTGNIQLIIKDDGGTENGGVDTHIVDIPVTVSAANLTVTEGDNCGAGEISLSASGADDYSWYEQALGGTTIETGSSFTTDLTVSTTYFVAGVFSGSESVLRVPVRGTIFELPEVPVIVNNAEVLSVTQVTGASYAWFRNGTVVEGETSSSFSPSQSGDYNLMITTENGCTAMSASLSVIITALEEEVPAIEVLVYPVPASDFIHLSFNEVMKKGTQIKLLDNSGKELTSLEMPLASDKARLDVRLFTSGIHFITVQDGDKLVRKRVIIKR